MPSELTNTIEQFMVYVHRNEAYFTYIYVYHTNVFEVDNIYKNPPQMSCHLYFFCFVFISLWGSTHDSVDYWSAHRSPAARDRFKRVHDLCKAGWRRPGGPPKPKSWQRRWYGILHACLSCDGFNICELRGRSQLSTLMKAYSAYARVFCKRK